LIASTYKLSSDSATHADFEQLSSQSSCLLKHHCWLLSLQYVKRVSLSNIYADRVTICGTQYIKHVTVGHSNKHGQTFVPTYRPASAKYLFFRKIVGGKSSKSMFVFQENEAPQYFLIRYIGIFISYRPLFIVYVVSAHRFSLVQAAIKCVGACL
jgi:hypothetical protein